MRIKDSELEAHLKKALQKKPELPAVLESALFAKAQGLLTERRERIVARDAKIQKASRATRQRIGALRRAGAWVFEIFSLHPDMPATAATAAALFLALLAFHSSPRHAPSLSQSDLPDFPRFNNAPARYDAQRLAEQQAYEREVEDAHQKTSGGI